jgi:pimeloyl-ACP methyl ester carboxylesterase
VFVEFERVIVGTSQLSVVAVTAGPPDGWPVVLLHGFPYDPWSYATVTDGLVAAGGRVVTPFLRGFGPTRFLPGVAARSGQQAAIGRDAIEVIDQLARDPPVVVGFDWGGRAACIAAALWPERIGGLVAVGGYEIQDIAGSAVPALPLEESRSWYQYYFHGERGRAGLARYRRELTAQLWQEWAPGRSFPAVDFDRAALSFDNPDFVDVVIHSYRHRYGLAPGDPAYDQIERELAAQPQIIVPTIVLDPTEDPMVAPQSIQTHRERFTRLIDHRLVSSGHDMPHDNPDAVVRAVLDLHKLTDPI